MALIHRIVGAAQTTVVGACLLLAGGIAVGLGAAVGFGVHVPTSSIYADYAVAWVIGAALGFSVILWPISARERNACLVIWSAKLFVCLGVMLLYESKYDFLDAYSYFSQSVHPDGEPFHLGLAFGTQSTSVIYSGLWLLLPPTYHGAKIVAAYIGLIAIFLFYKTYEHTASSKDLRMLYVLGLFPSVLFWSSILGKDPLILLGIAMTIHGGVRMVKSPGIGWVALFLCGVLLTGTIRIWIALMLVVALLFAAPLAKAARTSWWSFVLAGVISVAAPVALATWFIGEHELAQLLLQLEVVSGSWAVGGSAAQEVPVFDSWAAVIAFFPSGAFTALFRPLPGEVGGAFGAIAGVENALFLLVTIVALVRARANILKNTGTLWLVLFVVLWISLYSFLSYQNLGAAVRFKAQVIPILTILIGLVLASPRTSASVP